MFDAHNRAGASKFSGGVNGVVGRDRQSSPAGRALPSAWEKGQIGLRNRRNSRPAGPWIRSPLPSLHSPTQHRRGADTQSTLRIGLQHILSCLHSDPLAERFIVREH